MFTRLPVVVAFGLMLASVCPPAAQAQGTGANWELLKMCMEEGYRPPETNVTPPYLPDGKLPPPLVSAPCGNSQAAPLSVEGAPAVNDPRVVAWVDPNVKWSTYPKGYYFFQGGGQEQQDLSTLGEPGWLDPKVKDYILMRTADPDGTGCAIRHRVMKGQQYYGNMGIDGTPEGKGGGATARSAISAMWGRNVPTELHDGIPYWSVWAVWIDNDHASDGIDMVVDGYGHSVGSVGWSGHFRRRLMPNGQLEFWVSSNPVLDEKVRKPGGIQALHEKIDVVASVAAQKGRWHYFVSQFKMEWDASRGPYYRVWHAIGDGPAQKIVDTTLPNAMNESDGYHPWKFGPYMWCVTDGSQGSRNCWGGSNTRTIYTKGQYIFRDAPGATPLNVDALLKLARSR